MSYISVGWDAATLLSAKNLNHMETQYAAAKVDIDLHGHPAVHYLKADSDAKFFPIASGLDADTIDGDHLSDLVGNLLPIGAIWIYKGTDSDFTNGYLNADNRWHQCDGSTIGGIICPDMRTYFPKCPTSSATTGTGGAATQTLTGTVTIGDHTLTLAEIPSHYHYFYDRYYVNNTGAGSGGSGWIYAAITNTGRTTSTNHAAADEAHNHSTGSLSLNAINLTPLWRAYHFIIKVA